MAEPAEITEQLPPPPAPPSESDKLRAALAHANDENKKLTQRLNNPPAAQPVFQQNSRPAPDPKELQRRFFENPVGEAATIAQATVSDMMAQDNALTFDTLRGLARSQARETDPELFDRYSSEVDQMVQQAPAQFQKNVHVWTNAFNNVKGAHIRDIVANTKEGKAPAVVISRSPDGPSLPSPAPLPGAQGPAAKLTPEQKEMAHKMAPHAGWDHSEAEERYAHGVWVHENQGSGKPGHGSSWDRVITTNNRFGKKNRDTAGGK